MLLETPIQFFMGCSATIHALRTSQNSVQMQFRVRVKFCMKVLLLVDQSQNQSLSQGDWRSTEPSGFGPEYRVVAQVATLALLHALFSQWFSFFVSTLEALNFQPVGLANPSAEGWRPQRGDVFPGPAGLQKARLLAVGRRARELVARE